MAQRDEPSLRDLLDEIAKRAHTVIALRECRVELQQRALQQTELWRDFAIGQHFERPLHERNRLRDVRRSTRRRRAVIAARPGSGRDRRLAGLAADEVLVRDELVTVLLHHLARELSPTDD